MSLRFPPIRPAVFGPLLLALLIAGCDAPLTPPSQTPYGGPQTPAPTPTPNGPGTDQISVVNGGVGTYQLVTVPVAVIHNDSNAHGAIGVVVHLTPVAGSRPLETVDAASVDLAPGETLAVTGNCTDTCTAADHTTATVTVGQWVPSGTVPTITASGVAVASGGGQGQASVSATLSGKGVVAGGLVNTFAACYADSGLIVGGGSYPAVWSGAPSQPVTISVIISGSVTHCDVYAATAGGT